MRTAVTLCLLSGLVTSLAAQSPDAIEGAWRVTQIQTSGANAATYASQPSLYLFTGRHYSIVRVSSREPRPQFRDPANITEAEALAIWGPFTGQAGTFEIVGGNLRTMPTVAKNPESMRSGRQPNVYTVTIQGDVMTLTSTSDLNGPIANPTTYTLARVR